MEVAGTVPSLPRSTGDASWEHEVVKSQPVTTGARFMSFCCYYLSCFCLLCFPRFCGSLILPTCPLHTNRSRSCNYKLIFFFCLHWVFVAVHKLSLVTVCRQWLLLQQNMGSRHAGFSSDTRGLSSCGSRALEHRRNSCDTWGVIVLWHCEIFLDQGSNPCLLHWQVGSEPLDHQRSPRSCDLREFHIRTNEPKLFSHRKYSFANPPRKDFTWSPLEIVMLVK